MSVRNVYIVVHGPEDKNYWKPCGVAFVNKDGSETLKLDLFPNLDIVIRDKEKQETVNEPDGEIRPNQPKQQGKVRFRQSGYNGYASR
jgi:hypothetical protein